MHQGKNFCNHILQRSSKKFIHKDANNKTTVMEKMQLA